MPVRLLFSTAFKRQLRDLARRYRNIRSDLLPVLDQLLAGQTPGDQVPGTGYAIYKVRLSNRDAKRGKSGGYRVIYREAASTTHYAGFYIDIPD